MPGYRWPAKSADGYAGDPKSSCAYGGRVSAMRIGDVYGLTTEWGPDGRVVNEFRAVWGFPIETSAKADCFDAGRECQWAKDMAEVFTALQVVDNNAPGSVGGGGIGRQPPAPPVGN
jgi:hypothetical protein